MNVPAELKSPAVLDACEADRATTHPPERALSRYVSNEMGPRRKKVVVQHLETCADCRKSVARLHAIARTFRDWERTAIAQVAQTERA
jgi:anti-sigma factor RsiW